MFIFKLVYWLGMLGEIFIRTPFQKAAQAAVKGEQRVSRTENLLIALLSVFMLAIPLVFSVTTWLDFANYNLPTWLGWLGVAVMVCTLLVFARAHIDLKSNWSPTVEIHKEHTMITVGIYRYIRHPMYASQLLWVIAQPLLLQNWLAGPLNFVFFIVFYLLRVRAEEQLMLETFGDQYREYMQKVGGLFPKLPASN